MATVIVYGASDDLIEVEGAIEEEFNPDGDKPSYLSFNDGTVLSVVYDDEGMWRVNRAVAGSATFAKVEADDPDENYSDRVTLEGDIKSVVFGHSLHRGTQRRRRPQLMRNGRRRPA